MPLAVIRSPKCATDPLTSGSTRASLIMKGLFSLWTYGSDVCHFLQHESHIECRCSIFEAKETHHRLHHHFSKIRTKPFDGPGVSFWKQQNALLWCGFYVEKTSMVLIVRKSEEKHVVVQCHHFWGGQTTHGTPSAMILETPRSHEMVWCSFEHMDATLYKMSFFKDFWSPKTKT
jgi:hypothetical protein